MDIKVFLDELGKFRNDEKKYEYVSTHIVRHYVPYVEKMKGCERIINATMYHEVDGRKEFTINTPARMALYLMLAVELYTDITYPVDEVFDCFDLLIQNGVAKILGDCIGTDYDEFRAYLDMAVMDRIDTERDLVTWLERKFQTFGLSVDAISNAIAKALSENTEEAS